MRTGFAILARRSPESFAALLLPRCLVSTPSLPCVGSEEELLPYRDCDRDISSHLKTYGPGKRIEDACDEIDLLLCHEGE